MTIERDISEDDLKLMSRLFEHLMAVSDELGYCEWIYAGEPEKITQLKQDRDAVNAIKDRIELWATGTNSVKRF